MKCMKIRALATAVRISVGVVQLRVKTNAINAIMALLIDAVKTDRVNYAVLHVHPETRVFDSIYDAKHID